MLAAVVTCLVWSLRHTPVEESHPLSVICFVAPHLPNANGKGSPAFLGTGCLYGSHPKTSLNPSADGQLEGDTSPGELPRADEPRLLSRASPASLKMLSRHLSGMAEKHLRLRVAQTALLNFLPSLLLPPSGSQSIAPLSLSCSSAPWRFSPGFALPTPPLHPPIHVCASTLARYTPFSTLTEK